MLPAQFVPLVITVGIVLLLVIVGFDLLTISFDPHHDTPAIQRHFAMHSAPRRAHAHVFPEAKHPRQPLQCGRDIAIEDVRNNFGAHGDYFPLPESARVSFT